MSPPIRDGSGNDIGSIRLGDGSEISEVRTGAGDVLFSAIPDSAVARWRFEEDVTDSRGNNDLTDNSSAGFVSGLAPIGDFAKDFDGTDDYAFASSPVIDMTSGTAQSVAMWVSLDDVSSNQRIINQNDDTNGFRVFFDREDDDMQFFFEDSGTPRELNYNPSLGTPEALVLTKDSNDNVTLYEGDANSIDTATAASGSEPINTTFGAFDPNGTKEFADQQLDLVDVFSKELSATEVSNWYNTGSING